MYQKGDKVRLKEAIRGYYIFELIRLNGYKWIGKCSSGMEVEFYEDEIIETV